MDPRLNRLFLILVLIVSVSNAANSMHASEKRAAFSVSFTQAQSEQPIDGRLLLLLSTDPSGEPRMQINDSPQTQMIFGMDVDAMRPSQPVAIDDSAFGYPVRYLHEVPPGEYTVQVVLHRYETFHRADGHTVKLPMDRGEGQHWNLAPGNLYSQPKKVTLGVATPVGIVLDQQIPAIPPPRDTKYIRHLKIQSQLLTKFWDARCFSVQTCWSPKDSIPIRMRISR